MEQFLASTWYRIEQQVKYTKHQVAYMMIAATLFARYPEKKRMAYVKAYYDAISTFRIWSQIVMAGVRTPQRQFSSCVLIETDDSLDSINAASSIVKYVSKKAGIGIGAGSIRAIGPSLGVEMQPQVLFINYSNSRLKVVQGGVRGGLFYITQFGI